MTLPHIWIETQAEDKNQKILLELRITEVQQSIKAKV